MRAFASAASLAATLLFVASASAGDPPPSPSIPAPAAAPAAGVTAPPAAAPPAYPVPPPYGPGYAPPYAAYAAPGPGAPYPYPYWRAPPPVTERRSEGLRITGIALFSVGGLISGAGAVIFGIGANCVNEVIPLDSPPSPAPAAARGQERIGSARQALNTCNLTTPGVGLILGGLVTAIAGIPLFVIGSRQKPAQSTLGAFVPSVGVGAGNATLRWNF